MKLPVNSNTLPSAKRTEKSLNVLILPLKLAAVKAGECSITHDA